MAIIAHDAVTESLNPRLKVTVWGLVGGNADVELGILRYNPTGLSSPPVIDTELARVQLTKEQASQLIEEIQNAIDV